MLLNELVKKNENGEVYVSSLELHKYLGVGTRHNDWIRRQLKNYGFVCGVDYNTIEKEIARKRGIVVIHIYNLSLDCAKELAMIETIKMGRKARQYFIQCENELSKMNENNIKLGGLK